MPHAAFQKLCRTPDYAESCQAGSADQSLSPERFGIVRMLRAEHAGPMKHFIDLKLLKRVSVGPVAPYIDAYLARIEKDGFAPSSVPCQAYAIARFSGWLNQQRIQLEDVDESIVQRFLR